MLLQVLHHALHLLREAQCFEVIASFTPSHIEASIHQGLTKPSPQLTSPTRQVINSRFHNHSIQTDEAPLFLRQASEQ